MPLPEGSRAVEGYACAVAAATLAFAAKQEMVFKLVDNLDPFQADRVLTVLVAVLIYVFATGWAAMGPCALAAWLAARLGIRSAWFYILAGAATGVLLGSATLATWPGFVTDGEDIPPALYMDRLALELSKVGPAFAISGAVGAAVYWWINGRRRKHFAPPPPDAI